jgi:hypothetical protein
MWFRRRWVWGIAGVCLLLAACLLAEAGVARASHRRQYSVALARWQASAPTHYRIRSMAGEGCTLEVEVRNERVLRVLQQDRCMHPARTVSELFRLIERGQVSVPCFFAGCACRVDVVTFADYDATYGYPRLITLESVRGPNWRNAAYWQYLIQNGHDPGCSLVSESEVARVLSFTPLP